MMGTMNCPRCLGEIPNGAAACPSCAVAPPRGPNRLSWVAAGAAAILLAVAVGVLTRPQPEEAPAPTPASAPAPVEGRSEPPAPAPAPPPAVEPVEPAYQRMLDSADQSLARARMLFEEGRAVRSDRRLEDAAEAAVEARARFNILAEAFGGARRQTALERLVKVNELARAIAAAAHEAKAPVAETPTPPPVTTAPAPEPPPPAPKPTAPPPPPAAPKAIEAFVDYVRQPTIAGAANARRLMSKEEGFRPLLEAAAIFFETQTSAEPFHSSTERKRMIELLDRHPSAQFSGFSMEQLEGAARDALAALKALPPGESGELLRLWGLAHLARRAGLEGGAAWVARTAPAFELSAETVGPRQHFGTREGLAMLRLMSADTFAQVVSTSDRMPASAATMALRLEKWAELGDAKAQMEGAAELSKELKRWKPRDRDAALHAHLSKALKALDPCRICKGSGNTDCPSCVDGLATFQCERCSGYGRILTNGARPLDCPDCKTRGRWQDKCPRCSAAGVRPCQRCGGKEWSAPALEDMVRFAPCGGCDGGGFVLAPFKLPCRECDGLGRRPFKP
jgi:hypothetical protein